MITDSRFLRGIIANPADDAPRFMFADWLDEHGQAERAEFIRLQCELARIVDPNIRCGCPGVLTLPECPWCHLRRREQELLDTHSACWLEGIDGSGILVPKADFRRGFVAELTCTAAQFRDYGAAILQVQPVEKVALTSFWTLEELAELPLPAMRDSSLKEVLLDSYLVRDYHRGWLAQQLPGISVSVWAEPDGNYASLFQSDQTFARLLRDSGPVLLQPQQSEATLARLEIVETQLLTRNPGYMFDPTNENRLLVHPEVAEQIRAMLRRGIAPGVPVQRSSEEMEHAFRNSERTLGPDGWRAQPPSVGSE